MLCAIMMLPSLSFRSDKFVARHMIAMTSLAAVITKFSFLSSQPFVCETVQTLSALSFWSRQRLKKILFLSISSSLPWKIWLSIKLARRLFADVIAWKSPLKCKFMSAIGTIWLYPPPVAPPLIPNTGPSDGSRRARHTLLPCWASASARPIETVVFPLPAFVGLMAVTRISLLFFLGSNCFSIFALYFPNKINSSSHSPSFFAISTIFCGVWIWAISISVIFTSIEHYKTFCEN